MMAWVALIAAGICEMIGVAMISKLHQDRNWQAFTLLALAFGMSFVFLTFAMQTLPMSTAYAIWTGIGASGGALLGILYYNESTDSRRMFFIALVLGSAVGLKLVA